MLVLGRVTETWNLALLLIGRVEQQPPLGLLVNDEDTADCSSSFYFPILTFKGI